MHWRHDAVDHIVHGVECLAAESGYAVAVARVFLFASYSQRCAVVFLSAPAPHALPVPPSPHALPEPPGPPGPLVPPDILLADVSPEDVPQWQECVSWDWLARPKEPTNWHRRKLELVGAYAARLVTHFQSPVPAACRVLLHEGPHFLLTKAPPAPPHS